MLNRNRNIYIAIGLVILVAATFLSVQFYKSFIEYQKQHADQRQSISTYKAETNEQYSDNCLKEPVSIIVAFKCLINSIDTSREAQRSKYDLQAQQEMAEWAYALFLLTGAGLVISLFGLTALFVSLYQTRTVIKDNREIGEAQVRAYLAADNLDVSKEAITGEITRHTLDFKVIWKNTGQSPAINCNFGLKVGVIDGALVGKRIPEFEGLLESLELGTASIASGQTLGNGPSTLNADEAERWESGSASVVVYAAAIGQDVFGKRFSIESCSVAKFNPATSTFVFEAYPHHNNQ